MKKAHTVRTFLAGVLAALLVAAMIPPALAAAGMSIYIYPGISVYIDDQKLDPKDANGNPVMVFTYNGTTYLPVRAISEALGKPVQWEGATNSVYVGSHSSDTPACTLLDVDFFSGTDNVYYVVNGVDNTGATHTNSIVTGFDRTYLINGQYTKMSGCIYQRHSWRSQTGTAALNIYGDGKLIYTYKYEGTGMHPVPFDVDLTGVLELRVDFATKEVWAGGNIGYTGIFALDTNLWT